MSWSISAVGPKEESLDKIRNQAKATPYNPGNPEGDDIVAAVARIEALSAALAPSDRIEVSAYGSHSTTNGGISSASFSVSVKNVS